MPIFLSVRPNRASSDSKRILHTMCASPLMGMDRKECYRLTKISGYATACTFRVTSLFPGLPGSAGSRKANLIWILPNKQETVRGSDISWATCKSAPHSRQITVPASHRSNAEKYFCVSSRPWRLLHRPKQRRHS